MNCTCYKVDLPSNDPNCPIHGVWYTLRDEVHNCVRDANSIINNVDKLIEEGKYTVDSSVRHQLAIATSRLNQAEMIIDTLQW